MTRNQFNEIIDRTAEDIATGERQYTCPAIGVHYEAVTSICFGNLSSNPVTKGFTWLMAQSGYSTWLHGYFWDRGENPTESDLKPIRLTMLELFRQYVLTTKEYEAL